jgi:FtsZ-binding cell division protein ZapB
MLKSQIDGLSAEVESLKVQQAKAQELQRLHDEDLAKADAREKNLQNCLHEAFKSLHGKLVPVHHV